MKQLIVTIGLILLGVRIFGMMVTDQGSLYNASCEALKAVKEAYECTN